MFFPSCSSVLAAEFPSKGGVQAKQDASPESGPAWEANIVPGEGPGGDAQPGPMPVPAPAAPLGKTAPSTVPTPGRLIDQEPYDRIILDAANDHAVLEVFPLDLPDRQLPARPTKPLIIRLLNRPETKYEVSWSAIAKVELFEERVLQEAMQHVREGRFEEAYEYFQYLYQHYPKMAGLHAAYEDALWEEASVWYRKQRYDRSLAVLRTLWERNKDRPKLDQALGAATEKLVEHYAADEQYESARALLRELAACYPQHEITAKWEGRFRAEAADLHARAQAALEKNALREASEAARKMLQIWPSLPGAAELAEQIRMKYPRVVVGVTMPGRFAAGLASGTDGNMSDRHWQQPSSASPMLPKEPIPSNASPWVWMSEMGDWSARRIQRLLGRRWMELVAPGSEGGQYRSPIGRLRIEELGQRLVFQIRPNILDSQGRELTGYLLAEMLLKLADPRSAEYRPEWADRLLTVSVQDVYTVEVTLRRAYVRPEAIWSLPVPGLPGPYQLLPRPSEKKSAQVEENVFILQPGYFALSPTQPKEIVEVPFAKGSEAVTALRAGQVDVVDRVPPTELDRIRERKDLVVDSYAIPLVHVLVPNMRRPLPAHPRFRRALEYGIPREAILRHLAGGKELPGFRVLSGPTPQGAAHDDPIGYAYDRAQTPRPYNPRLALALARVVWEEAVGPATTETGSSIPPTQSDTSPETAAKPEAVRPPETARGKDIPSPSETTPSTPTAQVPEKPSPETPKPPSETPASPGEKRPPADPFSEPPSDEASPESEKPPSEKPGADPFSETPAGKEPTDQAGPSEKPKTFLDRLRSGFQGTQTPSSVSSEKKLPTERAEGVKGAPPGPAGSTDSSVSSGPAPPTSRTPEKGSSDHLTEMPPLVLLYPPTDSARTACRAIQRSLKLVGIPIRLQEVHPADLAGPTPPEFDLVYVELAIQEPVADLPRLFDSPGRSEWTSPFVAVSLSELYQAPGWREVQEALRNLHKITAQEVPFIPLWQTVEYFAYRKSLQGIGSRPVLLYENVEQWRWAPEPIPDASTQPTRN